MERCGSLNLQVLDGLTGEPIENYKVICCRASLNSDSEGRPGPFGSHTQGKFTVPRVYSGENRLLVIPQNREYWYGGPVTFTYDPSLYLDEMIIYLFPRRLCVISIRAESQAKPADGYKVLVGMKNPSDKDFPDEDITDLLNPYVLDWRLFEGGFLDSEYFVQDGISLTLALPPFGVGGIIQVFVDEKMVVEVPCDEVREAYQIIL